jgi:hypothetical protein
MFAALALATAHSAAKARGGRGNSRWSAWLGPRAFTVAALVVLAAGGIEGVHRQLGNDVATTVHTLRSGSLSRLDQARLERGYYENLLAVNRFNSQLWEVYAKKPANWLDAEFAGLKRFTSGFLQSDLIPSFTVNTRYGEFTTNQWGMRDKDYARTPAPGTFRIALLGASSVTGWGVKDNETFENLVETRLNTERAGAPHARYEILNLSVPGYRPPQQLLRLDTALGFAPHAVMYVATGREASNAARFLVETVRNGTEVPYPYLREALANAGVAPDTEETEALRRLGPLSTDMLAWIYRHIVTETRARGAVPVFVFLPQTQGGSWEEETPLTLRLATQAGFVVLDLGPVYSGTDIADIRLAEWDLHPNAYGHRLIAAMLYDKLIANEATIFRKPRP